MFLDFVKVDINFCYKGINSILIVQYLQIQNFNVKVN